MIMIMLMLYDYDHYNDYDYDYDYETLMVDFFWPVEVVEGLEGSLLVEVAPFNWSNLFILGSRKYCPRGQYFLIHSQLGPRAISQDSGCKIPVPGKSLGPRGVYFPILSAVFWCNILNLYKIFFKRMQWQHWQDIYWRNSQEVLLCKILINMIIFGGRNSQQVPNVHQAEISSEK